MTVRRALNVVGRGLAIVGVLLLLFTAYQLWGTGFFEARSQSALRAQLAHQVPPGALQRSLALARSRADAAAVSRDPAPPTAAPAPGQPVAQIDIPAIGLSQIVVEGVGTADLRLGPGHYPGTPLPGQAGNAAVAGHRTTYGHPFYNLNALGRGDAIVFTTPQGFFLYRVTGQLIVLPQDTLVLASPPTTPGAGTGTGRPAAATLTLTTCNPRYSAAQRLVVQASLVRSFLFARVRDVTAPSAPARGAPRPVPPVGAAGLAGDAGGGSWLPALGWALLTVAAVLATWRVGRRSRWRWVIYGAGSVVVLVALFAFFTSLDPLLPASF
jgi:sortase A